MILSRKYIEKEWKFIKFRNLRGGYVGKLLESNLAFHDLIDSIINLCAEADIPCLELANNILIEIQKAEKGHYG